MPRQGRTNLLKDDAPEFTSEERRHLSVVHDRIKHLEHRVDKERKGQTLHYDRAEISALRWLLEEVGAPTPPQRGGRS